MYIMHTFIVKYHIILILSTYDVAELQIFISVSARYTRRPTVFLEISSMYHYGTHSYYV